MCNATPSNESPGSPAEWRLPNGQDLISFALGVGLAAGPLLYLPGNARPVPGPDSRAKSVPTPLPAAQEQKPLPDFEG